jgi:hypothetical protein
VTLVNEFLNGNTLQGSAILIHEFHHLADRFAAAAIVHGATGRMRTRTERVQSL